MRVDLLGIGSRGDVQPLAALAVHLQQKGHSVRLTAGDEFAGLANDAGIPFLALGLNMQAEIARHTNIYELAASLSPRILQSCDTNTDAIISTFLGVSSCRLAREHGIPFFYVVPIPGLLTSKFAYPLFPQFPLGGVYNRFTHRMAEGMTRRFFPDANCLFQEPRPTYLFCFSEKLLPRPADWGTFAHVTGFWYLDRPAGWQPPQTVVDFLHAGEAPVCIGFGSMPGTDADYTTNLVLEAVKRSGQRAILVAGWGGLQPTALSAEILWVENIPYDWLFPQVRCVVHHGGVGTTADALRAGVPSVIVPFGGDQAFWGRRIHQLGVGPQPIPFKQLNAGRLADSMRYTAQNEDMHNQAARMGEQIRAEDGLEKAVKIIKSTPRLKHGS